MLVMNEVDYAIGGHQILRGISLAVGECETLAVLGASGSGKSTILRLILGLARPDRGTVEVAGRNLQALQYEALVELRKQMGIVFQEGALFDSLTVGENVGYYYLEHDRMTHAAVAPRVDAMLALVGLRHARDRMPDQLSGGMRRRVAIARALLYQPKLILYDEPTTGLDPVARETILELIGRLKHEQKVASVLVTHNLDDAAKVADRFVVIGNRQLLLSGKCRELKTRRDEIMECYRRSAAGETFAVAEAV